VAWISESALTLDKTRQSRDVVNLNDLFIKLAKRIQNTMIGEKCANSIIENKNGLI